MRRLPLLLPLLVVAPGCPVFGDLVFEDDFAGDTGIGMLVPCMTGEQRDALGAHLASVELLLTIGADAAGPDAALVWMDLPGLPRGDWYSLQLDEACPEASPVDYCTAGACYAVACTGTEGGWETTITLDPEGARDEALFGAATLDDLTVTLAWSPDDGALMLHTTADGLLDADGTDWSGDGVSVAGHASGWSLGLPGLSDWGSADVAIADGQGTVEIDGIELAVWDDGELHDSTHCF